MAAAVTTTTPPATTTTTGAPNLGTSSNISSWAQPYVSDMLGKTMGVANAPYQAYEGKLTAGASPLQQQAFAGIASLPAYTPASVESTYTAPGAYTPTAAAPAFVAPEAYKPTTIRSTFSAPSAYKAGSFSSGFVDPGAYDTAEFENAYQGVAGGPYQTGEFQATPWDQAAAQQYMNPYLMEALNPQLDEARRQAEISRVADASRLTKAGAYGGSRQGIMESEGQRNLLRNLSDVTGKGYYDAYNTALTAFGSDESRRLEAQRAQEQSRQFGYGQLAQEAQARAQYGSEAARASEQSRQFGYGQGVDVARTKAQLSLEAQRAAEESRQFGYGQQMTAAQAKAQNALTAAGMSEQANQFGYGQQMTAAQLQYQGALDAARMAEQANQFGYGQQMTAAQQQAQYGLASQQMTEASRQFAAGDTLNQLNALMSMGTAQRGIEQQGIAADLAQFEYERDYDMRQRLFQKEMLSGLPLTDSSNVYGASDTAAELLKLFS